MVLINQYTGVYILALKTPPQNQKKISEKFYTDDDGLYEINLFILKIKNNMWAFCTPIGFTLIRHHKTVHIPSIPNRLDYLTKNHGLINGDPVKCLGLCENIVQLIIT